MLYIFDLDGTLISGYMDTPTKDYHIWHVLPGRVEKLAELRAAGHIVEIATNQGAVAFGYVAEQVAWEKLYSARAALGLDALTTMAACFADARSPDPRYNDPAEVARRKPGGAMIQELINRHPYEASLGVLFVGDRPEDEQAAQNAGVAFRWAHEFFGD